MTSNLKKSTHSKKRSNSLQEGFGKKSSEAESFYEDEEVVKSTRDESSYIYHSNSEAALNTFDIKDEKIDSETNSQVNSQNENPFDDEKVLESFESKGETSLPLEHSWVIWYDGRLSKGMTITDYESTMKILGKFSTVEEFWRYWNNLGELSKLPDGTNLKLFKDGIKPMWEDEANRNGGKWVISTTKDQTHQIMQDLVLTIIGEQFEYSDEICGIILSVRNRGDTINLWNRSGENQTEIDETTRHIRSIIKNHPTRYQKHRDAMDQNKKILRNSGSKSGHKRASSDPRATTTHWRKGSIEIKSAPISPTGSEIFSSGDSKEELLSESKLKIKEMLQPNSEPEGKRWADEEFSLSIDEIDERYLKFGEDSNHKRTPSFETPNTIKRASSHEGRRKQKQNSEELTSSFGSPVADVKSLVKQNSGASTHRKTRSTGSSAPDDGKLLPDKNLKSKSNNSKNNNLPPPYPRKASTENSRQKSEIKIEEKIETKVETNTLDETSDLGKTEKKVKPAVESKANETPEDNIEVSNKNSRVSKKSKGKNSNSAKKPKTKQIPIENQPQVQTLKTPEYLYLLLALFAIVILVIGYQNA